MQLNAGIAWSGCRKFMFKIQINNECKKQNTADQRVYVILTSERAISLRINISGTMHKHTRFLQNELTDLCCHKVTLALASSLPFNCLGQGLIWDLSSGKLAVRSGSASKLDAPKTMRRRYSVYIYIYKLYYIILYNIIIYIIYRFYVIEAIARHTICRFPLSESLILFTCCLLRCFKGGRGLQTLLRPCNCELGQVCRIVIFAKKCSKKKKQAIYNLTTHNVF